MSRRCYGLLARTSALLRSAPTALLPVTELHSGAVELAGPIVPQSQRFGTIICFCSSVRKVLCKISIGTLIPCVADDCESATVRDCAAGKLILISTERLNKLLCSEQMRTAHFDPYTGASSASSGYLCNGDRCH